jgi:hypothetical protein
MAIRFQLEDLEGAINKIPESAINTPRVLTADFVGMRLNAMMPPLPDVTKTAGTMIGDGQERAQHLRRGWSVPLQLTVGGQLNTETAARLGARNLGGTRTSTEVVVASGAYDVVTNQQIKSQGRVLPLSTILFLLGGYDFLHVSQMVNNFEITFEGENDVNFSANLINTGYWQRNVDLTPAIVIPTAPAHHLMHPAATKVTFSDGITIDYANEGDLLSGSISNGNNVVVKQLPGDPFLVVGDRQSGAYSRDIHRGKRDPVARLKVAMDASLAEFTLARSGQDITSLTYLFVSDEKIGATAYDYEFEWKVPLAEVQAVQTDTDGDDAALNLEFYAKKDATSGGFIIQRIRTDDNLLQ